MKIQICRVLGIMKRKTWRLLKSCLGQERKLNLYKVILPVEVFKCEVSSFVLSLAQLHISCLLLTFSTFLRHVAGLPFEMKYPTYQQELYKPSFKISYVVLGLFSNKNVTCMISELQLLFFIYSLDSVPTF